MKKISIRFLGAFLILAAVLCAQGQTSVVIYDNSSTLYTPPGFLNGVVLSLTNGDTVGNTITFDPSTSQFRNVVGFSFQFYATNALGSFAGTPQLDFKLYANDGPLVNGVPSPNSLLYDSTLFTLLFPPINTGTINFTTADFGSGGVFVPGTLTWSVSVSGLGAGDQFGLVAFDPPTVGYDANYYWQYNGAWNTYTNSVSGANNFGAQVEATPEPSTVSLGILGGLAVLAAIKRRQRKQ